MCIEVAEIQYSMFDPKIHNKGGIGLYKFGWNLADSCLVKRWNCWLYDAQISSCQSAYT